MKEEKQPIFQANVEPEKDLNEVDLSNFDTSNVKNLKEMFESEVKLEDLDLSGFKSSKSDKEAFEEVFKSDTKLEDLDLSSFEAPKSDKEAFEEVFKSDTKLEDVDLSNVGSLMKDQEQALLGELSKEIGEIDFSTPEASKVKLNKGRRNGLK